MPPVLPLRKINLIAVNLIIPINIIIFKIKIC
nr:MAG TPA: hypothetical protein [Caudoviricetes sp.]